VLGWRIRPLCSDDAPTAKLDLSEPKENPKKQRSPSSNGGAFLLLSELKFIEDIVLSIAHLGRICKGLPVVLYSN
jgi:hypothetical protein